MNKKGQGLGFIAVLILVIILYFIFRYNTEVYTFEMETGSSRSHIITAYSEAEKTKEYLKHALLLSTIHSLYLTNNSSCEDAIEKAIKDEHAFKKLLKESFSDYIKKYDSSYSDLEITLPNYEFSFEQLQTPLGVVKDVLLVNVYGYEETCKLDETLFSFPKQPCYAENKAACEAIKCEDISKQYCLNCTWNGTDCKLKLPDDYPYCEKYNNKNNCENNWPKCYWFTSYSKPLIVSSPSTFLDYRFNVKLDTHIFSLVTCDLFNSYKEKIEGSESGGEGDSISCDLKYTVSESNYAFYTNYTSISKPESVTLIFLNKNDNVEDQINFGNPAEQNENSYIYSYTCEFDGPGNDLCDDKRAEYVKAKAICKSQTGVEASKEIDVVLA